ncbi:MAG: co-chaperone GroES [Candidatus Tectomicrobia bacterium]|nr:co-chaperone GroES [Candidatus Tectomicrobia bacterium]
MAKLKLLHDWVLVKTSEERGEIKQGGIIIPDSAKDKPQQGTVISAGTGKMRRNGKRDPMEVKTGDTVIFGEYAGTYLTFEEVEYLIMRQHEIFGVLDGQGAT